MNEIERACFKNAEFIDIEDAVPLILGLDPSDFELGFDQSFYLYQGVPDTTEVKQFQKLKELLNDACSRGEVEVESYYSKIIIVSSLLEWLEKRGIVPDIWKDRVKAPPATECQTGSVPPYLDRSNPNFSLELEIVIKAWEAVNNGYGKRQTFRQRACEWLEENHNIGRKDKTLLDWGNSNLEEKAKRMLAIITPKENKKI